MIRIKDSMKEALENSLDREWIDLVLFAKNNGLTTVEVRTFINEHQEVSTNKKYLQFVQERKGESC